jgi:hypothetical protein
MKLKPGYALAAAAAMVLAGTAPLRGGGDGFPEVLPIRDRVETVNRITLMRLEKLLPQVMRKAGWE